LLDERVPEVSADVEQLVVPTPWAEITRYPQLVNNAGISDDDVRQAIFALVALSEKASALALREASGHGSP